MKQMTAGAAVVLLVGLVIGVSVDAKRPAPSVSPSAPVVKADLMTIWSAYRRNAADADARYGGGRMVEVAARSSPWIKKTEKCAFSCSTSTSRATVRRAARCLFANRDYPDLARLLKMEKVAVRGKASWEPASMVGSAVVLQNCVLVVNEK